MKNEHWEIHPDIQPGKEQFKQSSIFDDIILVFQGIVIFPIFILAVVSLILIDWYYGFRYKESLGGRNALPNFEKPYIP